MTIDLTESAAADIADGYVFYEEQYQGLGDYFESSILADINSLLIYAGVHEIHHEIYHRKIATRFPYEIFYTIEDNRIIVHAAADSRRDPQRVRKRLN